MTRIDVINKIIEISKERKMTARDVIKGAMKIWQFNELEADDIIDLLKKKYNRHEVQNKTN